MKTIPSALSPALLKALAEMGHGGSTIGAYKGFEFYEQAKKCCCIVQSVETAIYANIILQKGVMK